MFDKIAKLIKIEDFNEIIKIASFNGTHYNDIGLTDDEIYDKMKESYESATGQAKSKEWLLSRINNWKFWGDPEGWVNTREGKGGIHKLTSSVGSPRSILRGLEQLTTTKVPIWGMVSPEIGAMLKKKGFKIIPTKMLSLIMKYVPARDLQNKQFKFENDQIILNDHELGEVRKVYVCNKEYIEWLLNSFEQNGFPGVQIPSGVISALKLGLKFL